MLSKGIFTSASVQHVVITQSRVTSIALSICHFLHWVFVHTLCSEKTPTHVFFYISVENV